MEGFWRPARNFEDIVICSFLSSTLDRILKLGKHVGPSFRNSLLQEASGEFFGRQIDMNNLLARHLGQDFCDIIISKQLGANDDIVCIMRLRVC